MTDRKAKKPASFSITSVSALLFITAAAIPLVNVAGQSVGDQIVHYSDRE